MPFKPLEVLKTNLVELLSPEKFAEADRELFSIDDEVFEKGINEMLARYSTGTTTATSSSTTAPSHAPSPAPGAAPSTALAPPVAETLKTGDFVATVWDVEGVGKGWYLGMVEGVTDASECVACVERPHEFESMGPCFDIRCMEPLSHSQGAGSGKYKFCAGFDNWHCIYNQLIVKVTMQPLSRGSFKLQHPRSETLDLLMAETLIYTELS